MCGYKSYGDCHSTMNQEQVVPKDDRVQQGAIVSEIEEISGSGVVSYYLDSENEAEPDFADD